MPVAVIMLTLNEAHNLENVLDNIQDWVQEIFIVDSYSKDDTVDIALRRGVHIVQRKFQGFGDQWNFALEQLPIGPSWTMKLDPDERLTNELKSEIEQAILTGEADALSIQRRLWFMGRPLPIRQSLVRLWRTGKCRFTDVLVNEHPIIEGKIQQLDSSLEHYDSPDLHHWYDKQNAYTTAEALTKFRGLTLAAEPKLFGNILQRRMWFKQYFFKIPFCYTILFLFNYFVLGTWKAGKVGYIWSRLRVEVYRARAYKLVEMQVTGKEPVIRDNNTGQPDSRVTQY